MSSQGLGKITAKKILYQMPWTTTYLFTTISSGHMQISQPPVQQNLWSLAYLLALEVGQNFSESIIGFVPE